MLGACAVVVIAFLVLYPNLSALPMPDNIISVYNGFLPTWFYGFQFAVNLQPAALRHDRQPVDDHAVAGGPAGGRRRRLGRLGAADRHRLSPGQRCSRASADGDPARPSRSSPETGPTEARGGLSRG